MKKLLSSAVAVFSMLASPSSAAPAGTAEGTIYQFELPSIDGGIIKLDQWRGKVVLIVNTASFCGYTKQYAGLQELWAKYEDKGLVVLGVPSNDFGAQEPKAEGEIKSFCQGAFGVTFPLAAKQVVTGNGAHPLYKWLSAAAGGEPRWNFHKFLIGRDGKLARAFTSSAAPMSGEVASRIEAALAASAPQATASH